VAAESDRPDRFRLAWTGKTDVGGLWQLRANVLAGREFGDAAGGGVLLETRLQATRRLPAAGARLGLDLYSGLNRTTDFGGFDEQAHQLGPIFKGRLGPLKLEASWLFGISAAAPDHNARLVFALPL